MATVQVYGEIVRVDGIRDVKDSRVLNFVVREREEYNGKVFDTYISCSLWNERADTAMSEGAQVALSGRVKAGTYKGKDGNYRGKLEVRVRDIVVGGSAADDDWERQEF